MEKIWAQIRDPSASSVEVRAAIVQILRVRAAGWETVQEAELQGECHALADLLEGKAQGFASDS